jgi:putative nucleotidyltransferase with HDIG domain
MSKATRYVWTVNVVGIAVVVASAVQLMRSPVDTRWFLLAGLALISGTTVLRLPVVAASFSVGDAFSFAALFLYGVETATLTVALDALAITLRLKGSLSRTSFNLAAPCLAMWCAGMLVFRVARLPLPVDAVDLGTVTLATTAAVAIMFGVGSWLVAGAIALTDARPIHRVWREDFVQLWVNPAACGYIGVLTAIGLHRFGVVALLTIVPIPLMLYFAFRTGLGRLADHVRHLTEFNRMHQSTIEAFATAVDAKDQVTHGHTRRVQSYCVALARDLKADDAGTLKALEAAALLHDVGKIGIPEHILNKPGPLTPAEFLLMKRHVAVGIDILSTVEFPFPVVPIIAHHHENWDGSGYPAGVRGDSIPLAARILSVVDCFDALTSDRPYRAAMSVEEAFDVLRARRGTMYDSAIVDRFIALQPRLSTILEFGIRAPDPAERVTASPGPVREITHSALATSQALVEMLAAALPNNLCVAYVVDVESNAVVACATAGLGAEKVGAHRLALGYGVSGWVAAYRSAIEETDAALDFPATRADAALIAWRCSSVCLPLVPPLVITVYGPPEDAPRRLQVIRQLAAVVTQLEEASIQRAKMAH